MKESFRNRTLPIFCAALMIGATGCSPEAKQTTAVVEETPAIKVNTLAPTYASLEQQATFAGKISPDETVAVIGKIGGTVQGTNFEVGDTVRKGQVLFTIDPTDIQLQVDQAKASYDLALKGVDITESGSGSASKELSLRMQIDMAQQSYERARDDLELKSDDDFDMHDFRKVRTEWKDASRAYEKDPSEANWDRFIKAEKKYYDLTDDYSSYQGYVTAFENAYTNYENALEQYQIYTGQTVGETAETSELQRRQAESAYNIALQKLADTQVFAPIDGIIEQKNISANETYGSTPAYVISNKSIVNVEFSVSADIARAMSIGDAVVVESGSTVYNAEIVEIGNAASSGSGLFTVKARIEEGSDLFTGVSVKLTAITAKAPDALTIPISAIYYESGMPYVYVAQDGLAVKTPLTVGVATNELIEVREGLSPDDALIVSWNPNLNDGVAVEVIDSATMESSSESADPAVEVDGQVGQEG